MCLFADNLDFIIVDGSQWKNKIEFDEKRNPGGQLTKPEELRTDE